MTSVQNRGWLLYRGWKSYPVITFFFKGHYKIPLMNQQTYLLEWRNGASKVLGLRFRTANFWKGQIWELDSHDFPNLGWSNPPWVNFSSVQFKASSSINFDWERSIDGGLPKVPLVQWEFLWASKINLFFSYFRPQVPGRHIFSYGVNTFESHKEKAAFFCTFMTWLYVFIRNTRADDT